MASHVLLLGFLAVTCSIALADETPLQDFCVADLNSPVFVNGFACKDPKLVQLDDFFFSGLSKAGNTSNALGSEVTHGFVTNFPALNTLGIGMARIDFAPHGLNPPHYHPRASEILTVIEGTLLAGFVTSNPENRLFAKVLQKGESVVYPEALLHFQQNVGNCNAVALAVFNSQNPDVNTIANSVFGSNPAISSDILAKAFQVSKSVIDDIKSKF
ncbi:putative germin-like protein 2-1 [Rhododendron vialii]|uniref:putative germin-like protein 2-1 n=1 Tax=Rhododendron vialii TaxID=182163 RepID=UPI00265FEE46|nr:putative germin-like protein 2-1 [Rhododendron vialii]